MKKIIYFYSLLFLILIVSCEKAIVVYPGNNQNSDPQPPQGDISWAIDPIDGKGQLPENSAPGLTIGTLNATDPNPDDEFTFTISSQRMDNTAINYFTLNTNEGVTNLELSYGSIDYEALTGSKQVDVVISVSDDSVEPQTTDFSLTIDVINVNETPYFTNLNSISRYADEYIEYNGNRITWSDIDEGDNPVFTFTEVPEWLTIENDGQMLGNPEHDDIGNHSFLLQISDGEIEVQEEITIEVRENQAPIFTNLNSIPLLVRVGCYDDGDQIVNINWNDPNGGIDIVEFAHQGTESVEWLSFDNENNGILFCVRAPENGDAGTFPIEMTVRDDRPSVADSSVYSFDFELRANGAPEFSNLGAFPESMTAGDTLEYNIDWQDPDNDVINFSVTESWSWFVSDNSGNVTITPDSSHIGNYNIQFNINDGCYIATETRTFTIE